MNGDITKAFLDVVSEKTGYPVETLELDMDMEADLGIDSIKRVEILGGVRAVYPDLPKVDPETFAELRTLRQVKDHLEKSIPSAAVSPFEQPVLAAERRGSHPYFTRAWSTSSCCRHRIS